MFNISKSKIGITSLLEISGRIDSINAESIHQTINNEISYQDPHLILDMHDVNYMSAAGLRILKSLHENSGKVRIASPSKRVREVLSITGLDAVYQVFDSRMEAIHAVQPVTNGHTHLELGWMAKYRPDILGMDFVDWLNDVGNQNRKELGAGNDRVLTQSIEQGIAELIGAGTTMLADISSTGLSIEPLLHSGLHGIVYVEIMGIEAASARKHLNDVQDKINRYLHQARHGMKIGFAFHAPYSVHPELWKLSLDYVKSEKLPLCIHIAESSAEYEYMSKGTGSLAEKYYKDASKIPSPMKSPVKYLADLGLLELKPLLVHAVHVDDEDIKLIKEAGCTVVHCPRSNIRLRNGRMPLEKFLEAGIPVVLGTDGLGHASTLNVFDEVEISIALHHDKVKPDDILKLTSNTIQLPEKKPVTLEDETIDSD